LSATQPCHYVLLHISFSGHRMSNSLFNWTGSRHFDKQSNSLRHVQLGYAACCDHPSYMVLAARPLQQVVRTIEAMDSRPTVFLVDDDEQMRQSLRWLLERNGYQVVATANSAEALATYDPSRPGCLLLDIQLPEVTGIELFELLRQRGRVHPFIILTAYGRIPLAVEAMRLGAIDFIEKPFQSEQLLLRVAEAVAKDVQSRRSDEETKELLKRIAVLGPREWQVAELVAEGKSSKDIARILDIKLRTVEVHRHNINKKLGTQSPTELAALISRGKAAKGNS
jgi:two-component system response regulator FixJ